MKPGGLEVVYLAMEVALMNQIPNYAGGFGVLAADLLYSCAELGINVAGVSIIYHLNDDKDKAFDPSHFMKKREETVEVLIEDRKVKVAIWQMDLRGRKGHIVPVFFLSSYLPENKRWDRDLTKDLYPSDRYTRLAQEAILGIGSLRALDIMGYKDVRCFHLNEGHCALAALEIFHRSNYDLGKSRALCVFTTHTPVPAGHDHFEYNLVYKTLGDFIPGNIKELATADEMNMTRLGINLSRKINSVSKKHREVCLQMFPGYPIENVTNGIYHNRWAGGYMRMLFDRYLQGWQANPEIFKKAPEMIPSNDLFEARKAEKRKFINWINSNFDFLSLDENILTIGFARRFVFYKRPDFIFQNFKKLSEIGDKKLQLVFATRCHPNDVFCNDMRELIKRQVDNLRGKIKIVFLPDYNLEIAARLLVGCDVWLNNPIIGREACGTSGMKAALNGLLNISSLDGWWIEGFEMASKSGWAFSEEKNSETLYKNLADVVDCYYARKNEWIERVKISITLLSFFNSYRMIEDYNKKIWRLS